MAFNKSPTVWLSAADCDSRGHFAATFAIGGVHVGGIPDNEPRCVLYFSSTLRKLQLEAGVYSHLRRAFGQDISRWLGKSVRVTAFTGTDEQEFSAVTRFRVEPADAQ